MPCGGIRKIPRSRRSRTAGQGRCGAPPRVVFKGSTPDAQGLHNLSKRGHPLISLCTPLVHDVQMALAGLKAMEMRGVARKHPTRSSPNLYNVNTLWSLHLCRLAGGQSARFWRNFTGFALATHAAGVLKRSQVPS